MSRSQRYSQDNEPSSAAQGQQQPVIHIHMPAQSAAQPQAPVAPVVYSMAPPPLYGAPGPYQAPPAAHAHQGCHSKPRCGRRRKGRFLKFLVFVGILWFTAVMSYRHGGKVVGLMHMSKVSKEMELSYLQRQQLRSIGWEVYQNNSKHRKLFREMRREFIQLMDKPGLTKKELDAFLLKRSNQIQKIVLSNSGLLLKARSVLTPTQRKILLVRMQQFQRKRARWRRHRHHHGQTAAVH